MTCYNPKIRVEDKFKWETALDGHKYHPATITRRTDLEALDHYFSAGHYKLTPIKCNECIGCKLDYSRQWANRAYLESLYWDQNYFVTLTYDDNNITLLDEIETPDEFTFVKEDMKDIIEWEGSLVPKELQDFMKRLRINMERKYDQKGPIRMMACGEYGGQTKRPHYHLILFNLQLPPESFYDPKIKWEKYTYFHNTIIEEAWGKGFVDVTDASWNTMAYVARYITKKINGKGSDLHYAIQGQQKEFFRVSNRPGIAWQYYQDHKEEIYKNDKIMIVNNKGVHYVKPPKYFDDMYKVDNPKRWAIIEEKRRKQNLNRLKIKDMTTSLTRWEQLQIEKTTKENSALTLKRPLE